AQLARLAERDLRARVAQDPLDLGGGAGVVHGDGDRARGEHGVVDQRPFVAGRAHQRDPVAEFDAARDEPLRQRSHLLVELVRGDGLPGAVDLAPEQDLVRTLLGMPDDGPREIVVLGDLDRGRGGELAHWNSCAVVGHCETTVPRQLAPEKSSRVLHVPCPTMPLVDLVDETFLVVSPARLAAEFADPASWARWWPTLSLEVAEDRGRKGVRWRVTGGSAGLRGSSEVWLEPFRDGTIVHFYL